MPGERSLHLKKRKGITMLHILLQSKVLLYLMTATGLLGLLCQIIGNRCYRQFIREAADALVETASTTEPDAALTAKYEARYQSFKKLYPALKSVFAAL